MYYMIDDGELNLLTHISQRLYTEQRLNADEMRDMAQELRVLVERVRQLEIPGE